MGSKILSGNTFSWGMAVRWFGTTVRGVIADNNLTDCNVGKGEGESQGAIQAWGLCYSGAPPNWACCQHCEYSGNRIGPAGTPGTELGLRVLRKHADPTVRPLGSILG